MIEFWYWLWFFAYYGFLAMVISGILLCVFLLVHPLSLHFRARISMQGQRGELRIRHLFGLLQLIADVSPRSQRVALQFWRWRRVLYRSRKTSGRKDALPPSSPPQSPLPPTSPQSSSPPPPELPGSCPSSNVASATTGTEDETSPIEPFSAPIPDGQETSATAQAMAKQQSDAAISESRSGQPSTTRDPEQSKVADKDASAGPVTTPDRTASEGSYSGEDSYGGGDSDNSSDVGAERSDIPPSSATLQDAPEPSSYSSSSPPPPRPPSADSPEGTDGTGQSPGATGKRQEFHRWQRLMLRYFRLFRLWVRRASTLWQRFSPALKRLLTNFWAIFTLHGPTIRCRFSLPDPCLTGMLHGVLASFGGILHPYGVSLIPTPVFSGAKLQIRLSSGISLYPWRMFWVVLQLMLERELWKGLWELFRWHRQRRPNG